MNINTDIAKILDFWMGEQRSRDRGGFLDDVLGWLRDNGDAINDLEDKVEELDAAKKTIEELEAERDELKSELDVIK